MVKLAERKQALLVPKIVLMFLHNKPFSFHENIVLIYYYATNMEVVFRDIKAFKLKLYLYLKEDFHSFYIS